MRKQFIIFLILVFITFGHIALVKEATAGTNVGGVINTNTTWTLNNSPYVITDTVQIPSGITLTIEPGVAIKHNIDYTKNLFTVKGSIIANGTSGKPIKFDSIGRNIYFNFEAANTDTIVDLNYCEFDGGVFVSVNNGAVLQIKNSILKNIESLPEYYTYSLSQYQPNQDIIISNNQFINSGNLAFLNTCESSRRFYVKNNLFYKCIGTCIHSAACDGSVIVENNSFIEPQKGGLGGIALSLDKYYKNSGIKAINNYWGTTNENEIEDMIYDNNDNIAINNNINYQPFSTKPSPNTPALITCISWTYSDWGKCVSGWQSRSIISSSPSNCIGGDPIIKQSCQEVMELEEEKNIDTVNNNQTTGKNNINNSNNKMVAESQNMIEEEKSLLAKIDSNLSNRVKGRILLQVEKNGEGWYVNPDDNKKYYLGRPADAFSIMRNLGLGIKHSELENYLNLKFPSRLSGKILLDVEQNGEAYYVNPDDLKGYYLNRPADAFRVMRELGLGITNNDIRKIDVGEIE